jgi:hypothetical protein
MCLVLTMFTADSVFNAMLNPIYVLAAGAVMGLVADPRTMAAVMATLPRHRAPVQRVSNAGARAPQAMPGVQPGAPIVAQHSGPKV